MKNYKKDLTRNDHQHYDYPTDNNTSYPVETMDRVETALFHIPNHLPRNDWFKIACALKKEFGDNAKALFLGWSENGNKDDRQNAKSTWKSATAGRTTIKTLYYFARQYGYTEESVSISNQEYAKQQQQRAKRQREQANREAEAQLAKEIAQRRAKLAINEIIPLLSPANANSTPYCRKKQCDGRGAYTLTSHHIQPTQTAKYIYPFYDIKETALVIPFQTHEGTYTSAQCIYGSDSKKRVIKGSAKKNTYAYLDLAPMPDTTSTLYIGEGYATVNSAMQANHQAFGIMAKDAEDLPIVTKLIRERHPNANLIILGDNDKSGVGQDKAKEAAEEYANDLIIPQWIKGQEKSTDLNDVHVMQGIHAVKQLLGVNQPIMDYSNHYLSNTIAVNYDVDVSIHADNLPIVTTPIKPITLPDLTKSEAKAQITHESHEQLRQEKDYQDALKQLKHMKANDKTVVKVCHRYALAGLVAAIDSGYTSISLMQDMKAGKTYAIGWIKEHHPDIDSVLYISHLEAINDSTSKRLQFTFYKDIHSDCEVITITCTLNSLPKTLKKIGRHGFDMVVFDETEGIAQFLASGTITNKAQAGETITKVCAESKIVVMADAHMGKNTAVFQRQFIPHRQFTTINNTYKPFKDVDHFWLDSKEEGFSYLVHMLKNTDKPLFIYSTSSALAYKAYKYCQKKGLLGGKNVLLACDKTANDQDVIAAKNNNYLFNNYEVVFASPTVGTGISIETKKGDKPHFEEAICFFVRDENTGNTASALQMPFRTRDIKRLVCVKVDQIIEGIMDFDLSASQQKFNDLNYIKSLLIRESYHDQQAADAHSMLSTSHLLYEAEIKKNDIEDKYQYYQTIADTLIEKGLIRVDPHQFNPLNDIKKSLKEINKEEKEHTKQAVIYAETKTDEEIISLKATERFDSKVITQEDKNSIQKHDLIKDYFTHDAVISDQELSDAYNLCDHEGLHVARKHLQAALQPKNEIATICRTWTKGEGQSQIFMKDEASNSAIALQQTTLLDRTLVKTLDINCVDGIYYLKESNLSNASIDRKTINEIKKVRTGFNAVSSANMPSDKKLTEAPAESVVELLKKRFNINVKKTRKPKLDIIKRQRINIDQCEFKPIGRIIREALNVNIDTNRMNNRSIKIDTNSNCVKYFDDALSNDLVEQYNHFVRSPKNKKHKKITIKKRSNAKSLFIQLAKSLLNVNFSKVSDKDEEWIIQSEQPVIHNLNIAHYNNNNNLHHLYERIYAEKELDGDEINSEAKKILGITLDTEKHIRTCLSHIHTNRHHSVLREYVKVAGQKQDKKSKFTPLATANIYLLNEAKITSSKHQKYVILSTPFDTS